MVLLESFVFIKESLSQTPFNFIYIYFLNLFLFSLERSPKFFWNIPISDLLLIPLLVGS